MAEGDAGQPVDADMDVRRRLAPARRVEVAAARRAAADEDRVEALAEHRLQAVDATRGDEFAAGRQRVADLLVDHLVGQAELRDLAAHHAAGLQVRIEHDDFVADRCEIAGDRQRRRPGADAGDALAVASLRRLGQAVRDVAFAVGGDAFQAADRDRLFLQAAAPARGLARAIAGSSQNSGEDVRLPVDHIGAVMVALGDAPNVFGHRRMRRAGPLTIDHFVEVIGMRVVGRLHDVHTLLAVPSRKFFVLGPAAFNPDRPASQARPSSSYINSWKLLKLSTTRQITFSFPGRGPMGCDPRARCRRADSPAARDRSGRACADARR